MAEQERKANKRLRIFEDYDKRQQALEDHAVQLLLRERANPNLPMIPSVTSARHRAVCMWCQADFWGPGNQHLCNTCLEKNAHQQELNRGLANVRREVEWAMAEANLARLRALQADGATPEEIAEAFKGVQIMDSDVPW